MSIYHRIRSPVCSPWWLVVPWNLFCFQRASCKSNESHWVVENWMCSWKCLIYCNTLHFPFVWFDFARRFSKQHSRKAAVIITCLVEGQSFPVFLESCPRFISENYKSLFVCLCYPHHSPSVRYRRPILPFQSDLHDPSIRCGWRDQGYAPPPHTPGPAPLGRNQTRHIFNMYWKTRGCAPRRHGRIWEEKMEGLDASQLF